MAASQVRPDRELELPVGRQLRTRQAMSSRTMPTGENQRTPAPDAALERVVEVLDAHCRCRKNRPLPTRRTPAIVFEASEQQSLATRRLAGGVVRSQLLVAERAHALRAAGEVADVGRQRMKIVGPASRRPPRARARDRAGGDSRCLLVSTLSWVKLTSESTWSLAARTSSRRGGPRACRAVVASRCVHEISGKNRSGLPVSTPTVNCWRWKYSP